MTIRIISDSTSDLTKELIREYDITILPLHIILDETSYTDMQDIFPNDIYSWSDEHDSTPKTSAPSLQEAINCFKSVIKSDEDELICFSISSSMSSSNNVMHLAANELEIEDRVHVIDSENLSNGIGLLILEAAKLAQKGLKATEIVDLINDLKHKVNTSFVVDTLTYLHRGGRCGGLAMMLGGTLKLHPKIVVENGAMHSTKKYRGHMHKVIKDYVNDLDGELRNADKRTLFIIHSGADDETVELIRQHCEEYGFTQTYITQAGGVISSHCGPGCLGLMFINS